MRSGNAALSHYGMKLVEVDTAPLSVVEFSKILQNHYCADTCDVSSVERLNEGGIILCLKEGTKFVYTPGDSISLICSNTDDDVSWLLDHTDLEGISPDQPLLISKEQPKKSTSGLPRNACISPRLLIRHFLELHAPASRRTLNLLANHFNSDTCSTTRVQKALFHQLIAREGVPLYNRWIRDNNMTIMDILATFDACHPTVAALLDIFPLLRPRAYSLVDECTGCGGNSHQELTFVYTRVEFCATEDLGTVHGVTFRRYLRRHGTCTGWLEGLRKSLTSGSPRDDLLVSFRENLNKFHHPSVDISSKENAPLILIAAGTGIAPFISFLQYRRRQRQQVRRFLLIILGSKKSSFIDNIITKTRSYFFNIIYVSL
ncbi:unnamed protein product [Schistocephalus solidus]|uniref:FAD_binding_1 domain-containing protein n=1 Tax=Schistocephalus solidus TaxID=70667 RepID=A0A183S932_SCHSO|nr:unnamed protein product [Schistocephalus solidus]